MRALPLWWHGPVGVWGVCGGSCGVVVGGVLALMAAGQEKVEIGVWPVTLLVLVVWCMSGGVGGVHWKRWGLGGVPQPISRNWKTSKR